MDMIVFTFILCAQLDFLGYILYIPSSKIFVVLSLKIKVLFVSEVQYCFTGVLSIIIRLSFLFYCFSFFVSYMYFVYLFCMKYVFTENIVLLITMNISIMLHGNTHVLFMLNYVLCRLLYWVFQRSCIFMALVIDYLHKLAISKFLLQSEFYLFVIIPFHNKFCFNKVTDPHKIILSNSFLDSHSLHHIPSPMI